MFFHTYVSSATKLFTQSELLRLLEKCRANNERAGITGMLLYKDGNFLQVLEGEEKIVDKLYNSIAADDRHRGIILLLKGSLKERQFSDWSMGFRDLSGSNVHNLPNYSEFLNTKLTENEFSSDPTRAQKLLLNFKKNM